MEIDTSKKSLCNKTEKKHEHTFSYESHYVNILTIKNLRNDYHFFHQKNIKNTQKRNKLSWTILFL